MENKKNISNIFYGVIGVLTLMIAVTGATFAYYTATENNTTALGGNMATVRLNLSVEKVVKVDETKGGMIPMSNGMVEKAVSNQGGTANGGTAKGVCVDDNDNAVCQIYKITLENDSSSGQFVDGYVSLTGGSGVSTDITNSTTAATGKATYQYTKNTTGTTMRWAQVFVSGSAYSTGGSQYLYNETGSEVELDSIGNTTTPHDPTNIKTTFTTNETTGVKGTTSISNNNYDSIVKNYIRLSDHTVGSTSYDRTDDITSALVFNHSITAHTTVTYYIVVWLSETGTDQTAGSDGPGAFDNANGLGFFNGNVTFISAQGSEISATFTGYTRVQPNTTT